MDTVTITRTKNGVVFEYPKHWGKKAWRFDKAVEAYDYLLPYNQMITPTDFANRIAANQDEFIPAPLQEIVPKYSTREVIKQEMIATLKTCDHPWLDVWVKKGNENPWIARASDPPFSAAFWRCETLEGLKDVLSQGNWSLGSAVYLDDICFINQINGGDEWLVIRRDVKFESITAMPLIKRREFDDLWKSWQAATDEQLIGLNY